MAMTNPGTTSLISWWKLNETSGNALDAHGSKTLTTFNGPTYATGKVSRARLYTSALEQVHYRNSETALQMGDNDFSVGVWVYLNNKLADRYFVSKHDDSAMEWAIYYDQSSDRIRAQISSNGTTINEVDLPFSPVASTWYFVLLRYNKTANTLNIRLNQSATITDSVSHGSGCLVAAGRFTLGGKYSSGSAAFLNPMEGRIDELCLYKGRLLSDDEGNWLYNGGSGRTYEDLDSAVVEPDPFELFVDLFSFSAQAGGGSVQVLDAGPRIESPGLTNLPSPLSTFANGVWTPTLTNGTNVAASTAAQCVYQRVGNVVTGSGRFNLDTTAIGAYVLGISLPLASDFTSIDDASGVVAGSLTLEAGGISALITENRMQVNGEAASAANHAVRFTFTFIIRS